MKNHWIGWRVFTEILIIDFFISEEKSELESFRTNDIVKKYGNIVRKIRPTNIDISATINMELHEMIRQGQLVKPIRGLYNIKPGSRLMENIYIKKFENYFNDVKLSINQ